MAETHDDLVRRQYATDVNLRIRQETHEKYSVPDRSFAEWVLQRAALMGGERVLDVGCGNGIYFEKIQQQKLELDYIGLDLLESMLQNHPLKHEGGKLTLSDAQDMPFEEDSFDLVMANHMLHHIEDMDKAISEIRRILKPGGLLVIATNSMNTMPELQVLMRRAIVLLTRTGAAQVRAPQMPSDRFALENGSRHLSNHFYAVVRHDLPSALVFPDVEPAMAYLESTRDLREPALPEDVVWEDVMMIMRQQINQLIKHLGELVINKYLGVLIASDDGSFIGAHISQMKTEVQS
jgi:2-polyprenyl-3-methyl-5-hydroxy-6-metoxy-1,4-benzoquinol methylase